jgi:signal transduction histidine kinase
MIHGFLALVTLATLLRLRAVDWPAKRLWASHLLLVGAGDVAYWVYHYTPFAARKEPYSYFLLAMVPYLLGDLAGVAFLVRSHANDAPTRSRLIPASIPSLMILAVSLRFALSPLLAKVVAQGLDITLLSIILHFVLSVVAIGACLMAFLTEDRARLLVFSSGVLVRSLASWAINVEYLAFGTGVFTLFNAVWCLGVFLSALPAWLWPGPDQRSPSSTGEELRFQLRHSLLLLILGPLTVLTLLRAIEPAAASFVALTLIGGIGLAWAASELLMSRIRASTELQSLGATARLSGQVAHDIQSPLAALETLATGSASMPPEERELMAAAISRIKGISDSLMKASRPSLALARTINAATGGFTPSSEARSKVCLAAALRESVAEKRLELRERPSVRLSASVAPEAEDARADVQPAELKRVLSNLINNAIQAVPKGQGQVGATLRLHAGLPVIEMQDNGSGIPPEILERIGKSGATFGKPGGLGLGLHHAAATLSHWGGRLEISSTAGLGTTVRLGFPAA